MLLSSKKSMTNRRFNTKCELIFEYGPFLCVIPLFVLTFVFQFLVSNILRNYLKTKPQNCFSLIEFGFRCPRICQGFVFIFLLPVWGFETLATTFFSVGYRDISRCAVSRPHFELEPQVPLIHRFKWQSIQLSVIKMMLQPRKWYLNSETSR